MVFIVAVPLLALAKVVRIERALLGRELKVVTLPRDGLDKPRGVEAIAAEPAGWLCGEPDPRFAEFDRIRPARPEFLRRVIVLRPGHPCRLDAGARTDRIERDAVGPGLERKRFDKSLDSVLDRAVRDLLFVAAKARAACDADDVASALRFHLIPRSVRTIEESADTDVDLTRPFFRRGRVKRNQRHVDRIMHHHIQPPPAIHNLLHHALALGKVGNIGADGLKVCAVGGEVSGAACKLIITDVRHTHPRARESKRPGDSPSQAACRAGYKDHSVSRWHRHCWSLQILSLNLRAGFQVWTAPGGKLSREANVSIKFQAARPISP